MRKYVAADELAAVALASACVTRCTLCDWQHTGSVLEGRDAHTAHRLEAHGLAEKHRRHHYKAKRQWAVKVSHAKLADNIAGAREQGAAQWAGEDAA